MRINYFDLRNFIDEKKHKQERSFQNKIFLGSIETQSGKFNAHIATEIQQWRLISTKKYLRLNKNAIFTNMLKHDDE
jgi:hypothetical protein